MSPKLYTIRKLTLKQIINNNYDLILSSDQEKYFMINQSDNMMFRQVRLVTGNKEKYNPYIIFVDVKSDKKDQKVLADFLKNGFKVNGVKFVLSEKSASMSRNSILGFIDESISEEIDKRITMEIGMNKTVISKYTAYRGLMFSTCFCIENWTPKVIVVDDYERIIPNQKVRYLQNVEKEYEDKNTKEKKVWKGKEITEGVHDIPIMPFDGCGLHHPSITSDVKTNLIIEDTPTSIMWRFPYVKGVTHEFDYTSFLKQKGIYKIKDIWGETYSVDEPLIILTKSMYKGYKYFQKDKTIKDWDYYWSMFKKYNHCIGVTKWNKSVYNEPVYTRSNYQILQDLKLDYDSFAELANDSLEWAANIIDGDDFYALCFLGVHSEKDAKNDYVRAVLKNKDMLKEQSIRKYLLNLLKKYIDEFKCGKLWLKSQFKILTPDLIMLAEYIGGVEEPIGVLNGDEFYSVDRNGTCLGEYLIERNPHICASEHAILKGIDNSLIDKWCSHLEGIIMLNSDSIILQRLNSADVDGDLALLINNPTIMSGVDRTLPVVMDMEDKITAKEEEINIDNIVSSIILSLDNRIGEYSNVSTSYHNKVPKKQEQKDKYKDYVDFVSILNGKEIDFAKTGVRFNLPIHIAKYAKPLPYFMKYTGDYYRNKNKLAKAPSNMNRLCWDIEKWHKKIRFKRTFKDFDYKIMMDKNKKWDEEKFEKIEHVYLDFKKKMKEIRVVEKMRENPDEYSNYFGDLDKKQVLYTKPNYGLYYEQYKNKCKEICSDSKELANYVVWLCYEKYKKDDKKFIWVVANDGILRNLKQQRFLIPERCEDGNREYLGLKYKMIEHG